MFAFVQRLFASAGVAPQQRTSARVSQSLKANLQQLPNKKKKFIL
jgi:hypothetical protein